MNESTDTSKNGDLVDSVKDAGDVHEVQREDLDTMMTAVESTPQMVDNAAAEAEKGPVTPEPEVEEPKEEEKKEEPEVKKEEEKPQEKKEEPVKKEVEVKKEETPKVVEEEPEETPEINEKLLKMMNAQAGGQQITSGDDNINVEEGEQEEETPPPTVTPPPQTVPAIASIDFVNEEIHTDMLQDAEGMNRGLAQLGGVIQQNTMLEMIKGLKILVPQFTEMAITREKFFENNEDLRIVNNIFANKVNELRVKNPKMPFNDLLTNAAKEVREATGLKAKVASVDSSKGKEAKKTKAKFADSKNTANNNRHEIDTSKDTKSEFDTQIDEMMTAVMS